MMRDDTYLLKCLALAILMFISPKLSFAGELFTFVGQVDFTTNEFHVKVNIDDSSSVAASAKKVSDTDYELLLDVEHLQTPLFDLLSKIGGSVEVIPNDSASRAGLKDSAFKGSVWSNYSLVDYKPVQELSGTYEVRDQKIFLNAISFGNLKCNGTIGLTPPYNLDLTVDLKDIGMKEFLKFWGAGKKYDSAGLVSGEIKAFGTIDRLTLKGNLVSHVGFVHKLKFDSIFLNIEGVYPHLHIADSSVSKSGGVSFVLEGPFDLSDKANFKKQIKALTLSPLVNDSGEEREWTIRRTNPEDSTMTELKYRFRKGDALSTGTSVADETDMFGFETTNKF